MKPPDRILSVEPANVKSQAAFCTLPIFRLYREIFYFRLDFPLTLPKIPREKVSIPITSTKLLKTESSWNAGLQADLGREDIELGY